MDNADKPLDDNQPAAETPKASRAKRLEVGHDRSKVFHAAEKFGTVLGVTFPLTFEQVAGLSEDEYSAYRARLAEVFTTGVSAIGKSTVPTYPVQLENFAMSQGSKGTYWVWPPDALSALAARLEQLGPGCELIPTFAMSVQIKLPSGKLILVNRRGEDTKG
jgi:hypothetical protein